jgi:ABC-type uncharacterized transport system auxiliary subunit
MKQKIGILLLLTFLFSGCFGGGGNPTLIRQYVPEYTPPQSGAGQAPTIDATIRVDRFFADRMFMGRAMIYRQGPYRRDAYPAQRWRVSPGDMVTEFLRRDLREAGPFRAVLSERDTEGARYGLTGEVEEFLESREASDRKALLTVMITLLDFSGGEAAPVFLFQKTYHAQAAITGRGGAGLAGAMSLAMADLSRQIIADIVSAVRTPGR